MCSCRHSVSVPSRGYLFFYQEKDLKQNEAIETVSVPSRGYLFFYTSGNLWGKNRPGSFPSPLGVISFFTERGGAYKMKKQCFRPLSGLSLFLPVIRRYPEGTWK